MPAPLPSDQLTIIRNLLSKGDKAGAIKVFIEATGATEAEAQTEVNNLASRYGLVGAQVPDLFVRRTPPKPAAPVAPDAPAAAPAPGAPPAPAPVAQQAANVPVEPVPPTPAPIETSPATEAAAATAPTQAPPPAVVPKPQVSPASSPQPAPTASAPTTKKSSRWGCSSVVVIGGVVGVAWWFMG